jgi:hypothetical protein
MSGFFAVEASSRAPIGPFLDLDALHLDVEVAGFQVSLRARNGSRRPLPSQSCKRFWVSPLTKAEFTG